jgi:ribosome-associated protein
LRAKVSRRPLAPRTLARRIARLVLEKKGEEVAILDLRGLSAACDYFVLCTAQSEQQAVAIADHVEETMREGGHPPWHVEGRAHRRWVLLDFVDVVVHVFHRETRQYYMLERLWGDAKVTEVKDTAPKAKEEDEG